MKNQVKLSGLLFLIFLSLQVYSQDEYPCNYHTPFNNRTNYDAFDENGNPMLRTKTVAVVYVDFLDGRSNGNQPLTYQDLQNQPNINLDAVAEIGLKFDWSPYQVENPDPQHPYLYFHPAKYTYEDRLNMFFSKNYFYQGNKHPDCGTHYQTMGTQAYGSFTDYWNEVSNEYFNITPAITHKKGEPQGIVNYWINNNGTNIIKYITLNKNKYGNQNAYMPSWEDYGDVETWTYNLSQDVKAAIRALHDQNPQEIPIDIDNFLDNEGGFLIVVMAGSHKQFKGMSWGNISVVRGMYCNNAQNIHTPYTYYYQIDGITCLTHEFAESYFGWSHSVSGRNDLLNIHQTKDINCPSHPNPIYKLHEGWVTPIHLDVNQTGIQLPPVENNISGNKYVGVVTIYGKPSGAPDHLSGECYVIENRKRIGFDRKLEGDDENQSGFKGGLLIWHYSPYSDFNLPSCSGYKDPNIKFIPAHGIMDEVLCGTSTNGEIGNGFFAYKDQPPDPKWKNFLSSNTYSAENLKTGIEIKNIEQLDYNDVNSNIIFDLAYTISQPPQYEHVIIKRVNPIPPNTVISASGNVFFHEGSYNEYYKFLPGARIEVAPNKQFSATGIKAMGSADLGEFDLVKFGSVGYANGNESYYCNFKGMNICKFGIYQDVDSAVFRNVQFSNTVPEVYKIAIQYGFNDMQTPVVIDNVIIDNHNNISSDIKLINTKIVKMNVNNTIDSLFMIKGVGDIDISNSRVYLINSNTFSDTANIIFTDCNISNGSSCALKGISTINYWKGIRCYGGNIDFNNVEIKGAETGMHLYNVSNININECTFNNIFCDIAIDNDNKIGPNNQYIRNSTFYPVSSNLQLTNISISNTNNIVVQNNTISGIYMTGIFLSNCNNPTILNNTITACSNYESIGILSYMSNGCYNCNDISSCTYGIMLDNSQPKLYQNYIHQNGIGMYVTNNSQPIMTPAFMDNQTNILAGYNTFYNSSENEIYIFNTKNSSNYLFMDYGKNNIVNDENNNNYLIFINNNDAENQEIINCIDNYWGEPNNPGNRLYPIQYYNYHPWLSEIPSPPSNCQIITINEDNTSKSQQTKIMGNILNSNYNNNYSISETYSNQLVTQFNDNSLKKFGLRFYYTNKFLGGVELPSLLNYFTNMMNTYTSDTSIYKYSRNMKIESEVINTNLYSALSIVDSIISNSNNQFELVHALVDKLRVLNLLDSTNNGGDNFQIGENNRGIKNANNEILNLIKYDFDKLISVKNKKSKGYNKEIKSHFNNIVHRLQKELNADGINSKFIKSELINNKIMSELMLNNYVNDIAPIYTDNKNFKKLINNKNVLPLSFSLSQNYPNPFNPNTTINYAIPKQSMTVLRVYDILGREIMKLVNEVKQPGFYSVEFEGSKLASGIYFYKLESGTFSDVKRMVLIK